MEVRNGKIKMGKKLSVHLYDEDGNKRNPLEVLREVKEELQMKIIEGGTFVLDEGEIGEEQKEGKEAEVIEKSVTWVIESVNGNGNIEIIPVNDDKITIHGEEMLWFLICRLLDCNQ